ncbi:hypothetical protein [Longispora urticae]
MTVEELVRSWKDPDHRTGTGHPAGEIVVARSDDPDYPPLSTCPGVGLCTVTGPWMALPLAADPECD